MLDASAAAQREQDVATQDLPLADDARHPPAGRRQLDTEVGAGETALPDRALLSGIFSRLRWLATTTKRSGRRLGHWSAGSGSRRSP